MAGPSKVSIIKERYSSGSKRKQNWLPMYQLIGEYVMTRKQSFLANTQPGEFLTDQIFSSVAPEANRTMASAIIGNLWPSGARSFRLVRPRGIPDTAETRKYYMEITSRLTQYMDHPEAGFSPNLDEYMLDQGAFGISGFHVKRTGDLRVPLRYKAINVKNMVIDEDKDGVVDTVFIDDMMSVRALVQEYGIENVSKKSAELHKSGKYTDMVRVLWCVEPRMEGKLGYGNKSLPYSSIHIEFEENKILRESGFAVKPMIVSRMAKALGEEYGRSPAMFAMPAILRLNLAMEIIMRASEKKLDPPLYLLDNGALGGGVVDTSPHSLNVFNVTGLGEKSPVGPLFDVGDFQEFYQIIESLTNDVMKAFYIDRLMDLNNETRMTLGETQIRDRIRGEGLSSVFKRQESEFFSPVIATSAQFAFEEGLLGVAAGTPEEKRLIEAGYEPLYFPAEVMKALKTGQRLYEIKYVSPANRIMRLEEFQGIQQTWAFAGQGAQLGVPDLLDNLDPDLSMERIAELNACDTILRDVKTIEAIREARAKQQETQMQIQAAQIGADVQMKGAQARSMEIGAMNGRPKG